MSAGVQLRARAELLEQLRGIVRAMKNLAFAQLQRVARERPALTQAREAMAQALADLGAGDEVPPAPAGVSWLVIGAERGFCGAFNAQLADAVAALREADPSVRVLVASSRLGEAVEGAMVLPGCPALEDLSAALSQWLVRVQGEIGAGRAVWLMYQGAAGVVKRALSPHAGGPACNAATGASSSSPRTRGPTAARDLPLHQLPLPVLRATLQRQAQRLLVQEAAVASLEQEHHARLSQMQRAQDHLDELGRQLRRREAAQRQSDITNELEMLASGG